MKKCSAVLTATALVLTMACGSANAQYLIGRWALGVDAGANYWVTDYNQYKVGLGGQVLARYEIARYFGIGLRAGYEVLQTNQTTPLEPGAYASYIKANAIPVSIVAFVHFFPRRSLNPYVYLGGGMMMYQRFGIGTAAPVDGAWKASYLIPAGFGVESFINNDLSFDASIAFNGISKDVDARTTSSFKGYASAKIGINFYLNEGPPHRPMQQPAPVRF